MAATEIPVASKVGTSLPTGEDLFRAEDPSTSNSCDPSTSKSLRQQLRSPRCTSAPARERKPTRLCAHAQHRAAFVGESAQQVARRRVSQLGLARRSNPCSRGKRAARGHQSTACSKVSVRCDQPRAFADDTIAGGHPRGATLSARARLELAQHRAGRDVTGSAHARANAPANVEVAATNVEVAASRCAGAPHQAWRCSSSSRGGRYAVGQAEASRVWGR